MYTRDIEEELLRQKFQRLALFLDEKVRRLAAANDARALGGPWSPAPPACRYPPSGRA